MCNMKAISLIYSETLKTPIRKFFICSINETFSKQELSEDNDARRAATITK